MDKVNHTCTCRFALAFWEEFFDFLCRWGPQRFDCGSAYVAIPFFYIGSLLSAIGALKCENTGNNILRRIKV